MMLCLSIALVGCSGTNEQKTAANDTSSNGQQTESATNTQSENANPGTTGDQTVGSDEEFTIRVGSWFLDDRSHEQGLMKAVEEGYKKLYPNAKIQWDITLGETYVDKLRAQFASDTAPDVIFYQGVDWIKANNFMDLSNEPWVERLTNEGKVEPSVFVDGKLWGVPMEANPNPGVWYNADMFNELGLTPPTTLQEFMDLCEKIKEADITPITIGFKDAWTAEMFYMYWVQSYGFANDPEFGKKIYDGVLGFDDPVFHSVFTNFETMKSNGYFNKNALSIDWPTSGQMFAAGEAAMIMQGPWMPGANKDNIANGGYESFQIGYFPLMDDNGKVGMAMTSGAGLAINAKTKLVEEAKALVNLFTTQDVIAPWIAGDGALPYLKDIQVSYADPVMDTVQQYIADHGALAYNLDIFIPASAKNALTDIVTKVVSGAKFDPADLKVVSNAFEKDKASVTLPY